MSTIGNYTSKTLTKEQLEKIKKIEATKNKAANNGKVILKTGKQ